MIQIRDAAIYQYCILPYNDTLGSDTVTVSIYTYLSRINISIYRYICIDIKTVYLRISTVFITDTVGGCCFNLQLCNYLASGYIVLIKSCNLGKYN